MFLSLIGALWREPIHTELTMSLMFRDKLSITCLVVTVLATIVICAVVGVVGNAIGNESVVAVEQFDDLTGNFTQRITQAFNNSLLTLHVTGAFLSQTEHVNDRMFVGFLNESNVSTRPIVWAPVVAQSNLTQFITSVRAEGFPQFEVFAAPNAVANAVEPILMPLTVC
jgi:hypothetical protein